MHDESMKLLHMFEAFQISHVSRMENTKADALATGILSSVSVMIMNVGLETLVDVQEYLCSGTFPLGFKAQEKKRLIHKARKYTLIKDALYHVGKDLICRSQGVKCK